MFFNKNMMSHTFVLYFCVAFATILSQEKLSQEAIFKAAQEGNVDIFVELMQQQEDLNIKDSDGNTVYHAAAQAGHHTVIELLADYDNTGGWWDSMRHFFGYYRRPDIDEKNKDGDTPLHCAVRSKKGKQAVAMLVWKGAQRDLKNKKQYTPVLLAAEKGNLKETLYLMHLCKDYDKQRVHGDTIVHVALANNHDDVAQELISEIHTIFKNPSFLEVANDKGETPLICCAKLNKPIIAKKLLAANIAGINKHDKDGYSSLDYACNNNNYAFAQELLQRGADVNTQDAYKGNSSLHNAFYAKDVKRAQWLLGNHADIKKLNKEGKDPLAIAIEVEHKDLIHLCITRGGDVNRRYKDDQTLLMIQLKQGNNDMAAHLIGLNARVDCVDILKKTALHIAVECNNCDGAQLVLKKNQSLVNNKDSYGDTSLHYAAGNSERSLPLVRLLVENKAFVDEQNSKGETPLHYAAWHGKRDIIEYLRQKQASLLIATQSRSLPAHYAAMQGKFDCLPLLLDSQ